MRRGAPPVLDAPSTEESPATRRETLRTEYEFELPRGYVDRQGNVHHRGIMRLATARDELLPLADGRVRENPNYLSVVLLARVITRLGDLDEIHAGMVENFFASDLAFLQDLYRRINTEGHTRAAVVCPSCSHHFEVDVAGGAAGKATAPGEAPGQSLGEHLGEGLGEGSAEVS